MFLRFSTENDGSVMSLERTTSIVRKEMLSRLFIATGHFLKLPNANITLGFAGIGNHDPCGTNATDSSHEARRKPKECTRYVKSQETPLPVCIGCMLLANILKKDCSLLLQVIC